MIPYHRPVYIGICLVVAIVSWNRLCVQEKCDSRNLSVLLPSSARGKNISSIFAGFILNIFIAKTIILSKCSNEFRFSVFLPRKIHFFPLLFSSLPFFLSLIFFPFKIKLFPVLFTRLQRVARNVEALSSFLKFIACLLACRVLIRFIL